MTDRVLDADGKFYFAKDAVLRPEQVQQAHAAATLTQFAAMKRRLDPDGVWQPDLARRIGVG